MDEFEEFCKSLHGLTTKEIYDTTVSRLERLEEQQKSADRQRKKISRKAALIPYIPDYSSDITRLKNLLQACVHAGYSRQASPEDSELFSEINRNKRSQPEK